MPRACWCLGFAALWVAAAGGCAQSARFQVWQPAEFDVAGIHRLAILDFRGEGKTGQLARSELVARLWDAGYYQLADPTELNAIVQTSAMNVEGEGDVAAAIEAGRRLGVDAILVGEVMRHRAGKPERRDRDGPPEARHDPRPGRQGPPSGVGAVGGTGEMRLGRDSSLAISLELVDVRTGQVRAQRQASYRVDDQIHQGHWDKAAVFWEAGLALDPKCHAAVYNLALAHAARFDYPRAVELLEEAARLHPNTVYREALARIQRHEQAYLTAMAQKRTLTHEGGTFSTARLQ